MTRQYPLLADIPPSLAAKVLADERKRKDRDLIRANGAALSRLNNLPDNAKALEALR